MLRFTALFAFLFVLAELSPVRACTICIGMPERSDADYVTEGHCVVLAREDPDRPFAFAPVEVVKGQFCGREIDLLIDSLTRRRLRADQHQHVVLVQEKKSGVWRSLGIASKEFEGLLRQMLVRASIWETEENRSSRVDFFLPLFGHPDPQIYQLAYLEISRAPYRVIRRLGRITPRERYAERLENSTYLQWRPLAILLLAQSQSDRDKQYIRDSLQSAQRLKLSTNLAAWASAAIEIDGREAVDNLEEEYFRRASRSHEEIREVFKAFSLHGAEDTHQLRDRIVAAYQILLDTHPAMGELVTRDMHIWDRADSTNLLPTTQAPPAGKDGAFTNVTSVADSSGQ